MKTRIRFKDLTPEQKKYICNGCGPKAKLFGFMPIKPPDFRFKGSCNHHDFQYWLGCFESHRMKADGQFYESMKKAAGKSWYFKIRAWIFYKAVQHGGKGSFNYDVEQKTKEDLELEILEN